MTNELWCPIARTYCKGGKCACAEWFEQDGENLFFCGLANFPTSSGIFQHIIERKDANDTSL